MADNNNKISIDIEINANGQQQLNQYKNAFDGLRTSINNLSNPIAKLDSDVSKLSDSISGLNSQNASGINTIIKTGETYTALGSILQGIKDVIAVVRTGTLSLEAALTGGLSVILTFLPEIINFTTALFKGKEAINAAAQNLKNLNEVMKSANSEAAGQITRLDLLRPC